MATRPMLAALILVVAAGAATAAYVDLHPRPVAPMLTEVPVDRGDIVESVIATGTLQPTRSVTVGAQVSGTIDRVLVDFNSLVHKGQVLALIDPMITQAAVDSAQAALEDAQIAIESHSATRDNDQRESQRIETLFAQGLETAADLDAARLQVEEDDVQVKEDKDSVRVAESDLTSAKMDLAYCTITSPIDGVVIARDIDAGQTVQSRMTAPDLFVLGTDLKSLTLAGDVDESDIARVRPGQLVNFTVESYPDTFHGRVTAVRLNASNTSNVITYQTTVSVSNPDLRLLPGMTANFKIETDRVTNVLRVSNTALRFRPTGDVLAFYGQQPAPKAVPGSDNALPTMPAQQASDSARVEGPITVDQLAPPFIRRETSGHVWLPDAGSVHLVPVRLGISDGTWTEVREDSLHAGQPVLTNARMVAKPRR